MSWRLEPRDLSGEWVLAIDELDLIMQRVKKLTIGKLGPQTLIGLGDELKLQGTMWRRLFDHYDHHFNLWQRACLNKFTIPHQQDVKPEPQDHNLISSLKSLHRLSPRFEELVSMYPSGLVNIDVGTDHAYLPIRLVKGHKAPFAFGVDIASSPLKSAQKKVTRAKLDGQVALLQGDGLKPFLDPHQHEKVLASLEQTYIDLWSKQLSSKSVLVTICGVGGKLASEIMLNLPKWVGYLIVQANDQPLLIDEAASSSFKAHATAMSIDNRRLFISKFFVSKALVNEAKDLVAHPNQLLWHWICLSRAVRRLILTPKDHYSRKNKEKDLDQAIIQFFSIK